MVDHTDQKSGGTQAVNLPGDALGVIVNASEGIVGKENAIFVARELDLVMDVRNRLGHVKGREMEGGGQALEEGFMRSHVQSAAEFGLTHEKQGGEGLAVHVGGKEHAELLKNVIREQMSFVEDEEGGAVFVGE